MPFLGDRGVQIATLHAADERIPVDTVPFGAEAIYQLLRRYGNVAFP
jgi:acetylornithine deacetylase/succinyl-diaminopimelate desuccinylase-like protein